MYIVSLIIITLISLVSATGTILAISGGLTGGYDAGGLIRSVLVYAYQILLPAAVIFFILSFSFSGKKQKSGLFLRLSPAFPVIQAITTVIIYHLNLTAITSVTQHNLSLLPLIIEAAIIILTFIGSAIFAIKSTGEKFEYNAKPKLYAFTALGLGLFQLLFTIIPMTLLRLDSGNSVAQSLLSWTSYLSFCGYTALALAAVNSARKPDRYTIIAWLGAVSAFMSAPALYLIAYL